MSVRPSYLSGGLLLALLLLGTVGAAGLLTVPGAPVDPRTAIAWVVLVSAAALPRVRDTGTRGLGPATVLALSAPFLVFAAHAAAPGGAWRGPSPGWWALVGLAGIAMALPVPARRALWVGVIVLLGVDAVLARGGRPLLPRAANVVRAPLARLPAWGNGAGSVLGREGLQRGAPVPVEAADLPLAGTGGPWFVPAARGRWPADVRLALVLGGLREAAQEGDVAFLPGDVRASAGALGLTAYDAVVVIGGAFDVAGAASETWAEALATYVRRGGLLVGPAADRTWPEALARRLGAAARSRVDGLEGKRPFGLGHVVRAASHEEVARVVADAGAGRPRARVVFAPGDTAPPSRPGALEGWRDQPGRRRPQGVLLVLFAAAATLLLWAVRGVVAQGLAVLAAAAAVVAGLLWTAVPDPGVRVHALRYRLGDGRVDDALLLSAGPEGWVGAVRVDGGGFVGVLGGEVDPEGRVRVAPGRTAWVVRSGVPSGGASVEASAAAGFLRTLVRPGTVEGDRLGVGSGPAVGGVEGADSGPLWLFVRR